MWHPSAGIDGRGHLSEGRWLLIGNSRWHWAEGELGCLRTWSAPAGVGKLEGLVAWAAVGPVPASAPLPRERRLHLKDVPLLEQPGWLGVDRALVGWRAWCLASGPVLVADGGTALSLTLVTSEVLPAPPSATTPRWLPPPPTWAAPVRAWTRRHRQQCWPAGMGRSTHRRPLPGCWSCVSRAKYTSKYLHVWSHGLVYDLSLR